MAITGIISQAFRDGDNNTKFSTDWKHLTEDERDAILDFIDEISEKEYIKGKNKESWLDDDREKIPDTDGYEEDKYWHYHCGPTWRYHTFKSMTRCLYFNPGGMASPECIHYYHLSPDQIMIVGFSRDHDPFLKSEDPRNLFYN